MQTFITIMWWLTPALMTILLYLKPEKLSNQRWKKEQPKIDAHINHYRDNAPGWSLEIESLQQEFSMLEEILKQEQESLRKAIKEAIPYRERLEAYLLIIRMNGLISKNLESIKSWDDSILPRCHDFFKRIDTILKTQSS